MSLISDALRKARQEAAARDRGAVIGPAYPPTRASRLGTGLVLGALIALAATLGGGAVAWWLLGTRPAVAPGPARLETPSTGGEAIPDAAAAAADRPADGADRVERTSAADPATRSGADAATEDAEEAIGHGEVADLPPAADAGSRQAGPVAPAAPAPAGERDFYVVAELGDRTLTLDYLVHRATDPFAQINGVEVHIGSTVGGCTVEAITADAVHLRDERGPVVLRAR